MMKTLSLFLLIQSVLISGHIIAQTYPISITSELGLKPLSNNLWIHTSTTDRPHWGPVPANGLALITDNELFLIDTPWNNAQTENLVNWFKRNHSIRKVSVIICHYHQDNLGGLQWIRQLGYNSYSIERTRVICRQKGIPVPEYAIPEKYRFNFSQSPIEVFFPGPGHTVDSIAVYLPEEQVLFGGCSIKAISNKTLGNTAEADLINWSDSLRNLKETFPEARVVVPGHGLEGGLDLIDHTIKLLSNQP